MKILHLLLHDELKFNGNIVRLFQNKQLTVSRHYCEFVTPYLQVYEALKEYGVKLDQQKPYRLVNQYASEYDYVFLHSFATRMDLFRIKRKYFGKLIWRTWGGDSGYTLKGSFFKDTIRRALNWLLKFRYRKLRAIGIANTVDVVDLKEKFGITENLYRMPYFREIDRTPLLREIRERGKTGSTVNILVEHSAWDSAHCDILRLLEKYKDQDIRVFLSLSYGSQSNVKKVKEFVRTQCREWKDKIECVLDFMPYEKYVEFLNNIDIAFFNARGSSALGNIILLLFFKKKIFLNRKGIIAKAFCHDKIPHCYIEEIRHMDYETFAKPLEYPSDLNTSIAAHTLEENISAWEKLLKELERSTK